MESLIVYGIIAIAVIVNIIKTFKKETEKNRNMSAPQAPTIPYSKPIVTNTKKETKSEKIRITKQTNLSSVQETFTSINTLRSADEEMAYELAQNEERIFSDEITDTPQQENRNLISLDNEDDLKRAILYSIILEKKYNI